MSEYAYDEFDDDFDEFGEEPSRRENNALRELRKANRAKDKQIKELMEQLTTVNKSVREQSVKEVLTSKGINPKVAALIPSEIQSPDEVTNWLSEYGDVFGITQSEQGAEAPAQKQVDPALESLNRISSMQNSGQPFTNDADQIASLIANARGPEELNEILFGSTMGPQALDRKSTRLNSSHTDISRMPSSA